MSDYLSQVANDEFTKAKARARLQGLMKTLSWKNNDLLSWYEVTSIIKPKSETYIGMRTIPVNRIIGSEGRYRDFSAAFLPKREMLRHRWVSVDEALHSDVILPPISVYSLGGWYFVRDGNHRVSVAKTMGQEFIDAEVVELDSKIPLEPGMSMRELRRRVVQYEREMFIEQYGYLPIPMGDIVFTTPGAYPELVNHILVHKYFINQSIDDREIPIEEAAKSWYENVYSPIVKVVREEHLLSSFPGNTEGDMYMWLVRRWDNMKREKKDSTIEDTVKVVEKESGVLGGIKRRVSYLFDILRQK